MYYKYIIISSNYRNIIIIKSMFLITMRFRALWCFMIGVTILVLMCGYSGLLIYAWYHECDPLTTKVIFIYLAFISNVKAAINYWLITDKLCVTQLARAKDQLLPLLVMNVLGDFPGLPGLFVAGVFSAALR